MFFADTLSLGVQHKGTWGCKNTHPKSPCCPTARFMTYALRLLCCLRKQSLVVEIILLF